MPRESREAKRHRERYGERATDRALRDAAFGRGPLAGKTGDCFKDDPFFNPWAPGGRFASGARSSHFKTIQAHPPARNFIIGERGNIVDADIHPTGMVLSQTAQQRISAGLLILIAPGADVLTPEENAIFTGAEQRRSSNISLMRQFSEAASGQRTEPFTKIKVGSSYTRPGTVREEWETTEKLAKERQARLTEVRRRLDAYLTDNDRQVLARQSPYFDYALKYMVPKPDGSAPKAQA
jgi:hypothetical protein